jgi:hypothetical protein
LGDFHGTSIPISVKTALKLPTLHVCRTVEFNLDPKASFLLPFGPFLTAFDHNRSAGVDPFQVEK